MVSAFVQISTKKFKSKTRDTAKSFDRLTLHLEKDFVRRRFLGMPKTSLAPHDATSLKNFGEWLIDLGGQFVELSARYQADCGSSLDVKKDDQRKRAIPFLNGFLAASKQALDDHLEETGAFIAKAAKPKPKKADK
jgi:hypothetical protein